MYLLDTNVVSELRRARPHGGVLSWLSGINPGRLHLSAVTIGEIQAGIEITREQDDAKAEELEDWLNDIVATQSVLPMEAKAFREWALLMHRKPRTLVQDAMIAATSKVHGLTLVTRNTRDFDALGMETINPFK